MEKDALRWVLDAVGDNARNSAILYIAVFSAVRPAVSIALACKIAGQWPTCQTRTALALLLDVGQKGSKKEKRAHDCRRATGKRYEGIEGSGEGQDRESEGKAKKGLIPYPQISPRRERNYVSVCGIGRNVHQASTTAMYTRKSEMQRILAPFLHIHGYQCERGRVSF